MGRICIDPGHGGSDPGAVNGALAEKDVVLDVGLRLKKLLLNAGYEVIMTRENDAYLTPRQKAGVGNRAKADIFVSLHCNSAASEQANGTEVLVYDDIGEAYRLGECLQRYLIGALGLRDRGVKLRPDLIVLNSTKMPAALAEIAFISNANEKLMLARPSFRAKAAEAIFKGIQDYLGGVKVDREEISFEEAKAKVKDRFGFDENTMKYLEFYRYGEQLIKRLAERVQ